MSEAAKQIDITGRLPEVAPASWDPRAAEVYAQYRDLLEQLENTMAEFEMVHAWCDAVALRNFASKRQWAAMAKEEENGFKNGEVRESDVWGNKVNRLSVIIKQYGQDLGIGQAVRRRMKQDAPGAARKSQIVEDWKNWFGEPVPNPPPDEALAAYAKKNRADER